MAAAIRGARRSPFLNWWARRVRALPKGRYWAFLAGWILAGRPARFVGELAGQPFVVDARDRYTAMHMFLWGTYEPELSLAFVSRLRPGMTVVDIGANKGYFSVLASRAVRPAGRVVSYEPLPRNFADLAETATLSGHGNWTCRAAAITSRHAEVLLRDSAHDLGHSGWAAVAADGTIRIDGVTLDDEIESLRLGQLDVLKMDVEGHEAEVLVGMRQCLAHQRVTHVLIEIHLALLSEADLGSVVAAFRDHGYRGYILQESPANAAVAAQRIRDGAAGDTAFLLREFTQKTLRDAGVTGERLHMLWTTACD